MNFTISNLKRLVWHRLLAIIFISSPVLMFCFPSRVAPLSIPDVNIESIIQHRSVGPAQLRASADSDQSFWTNLVGPLTDDILSVLATSHGTILAGTGHSIVRSSDHGLTWSQSYSPVPPVGTIKLHFSGAIIAVVGNGLQRAVVSSDEGKTWRPITMNNDSIWARVFVTEAGCVILQDESGAMYHSRDLGKNWYPVKIPNNVGRLFDPSFESNGEAITVTDKKKLLYTKDDGRTWRNLGTQFPYGYLSIRLLDNRDFFLIQGSGSTFRSKDSGATWAETRGRNLRGLLVNRHLGHLYVASETEGLLESFDYGRTWRNLGLPGAYVSSLAFEADSSLLVGTYSRGLFRFSTSDTRWSRLTTGWSLSPVRCVAVDSDRRIFVGTDHFGIFRLTKQDHEWTCVGLAGHHVVCMLVDRRENLVALTDLGAIAASSNHGDTWDVLNNHDGGRANSIAMDTAGNVFARLDPGISRLSEDRKDLVPISATYGEIGDLHCDLPFNAFYALSYHNEPSDGGLHSPDQRLTTLCHSTDGGKSWKELLPQQKAIRCLAVGRSGAIILGTEKSGVLRSTNQGKAWKKLGLDSVGIKHIQVLSSTTMIAATDDNYIYVTTDLGKNWRRIDLGIPTHGFINVLFLDAQQYLYAGGWHLGLYRTRRPLPQLLRTARAGV